MAHSEPFCLLTCYALLLTYDLDRVPLINPDEAGYAEPAWTLITRGEFGAPMYAGMFGMDHRPYIICPGRGIMTILPYMIFGPTLTAARLVSVAMAMLLALLSGIVLRRVLERPLAGLDWLAMVALMTSPVVVNAGRFARPEIDVAAWPIAMMACLQTLERVEASRLRRAWAMGAGVCAGLAFLMHQYGLVSLGAGLLIVGSPWPSNSGSRMRDVGWMFAGLVTATCPWAMFILSDIPDFRLQFGAQVAFQAWRYPAISLMRTPINEIPGRYLLDRQDYPVDWDAWADALRLLVPTFSMSETWWPLGLALRIARRPSELGPVMLDRLWWMGISLAVIGLSAVAMLRSRRMLLSGVLLIPALAWALALALVPNKWLGYSASFMVFSGLSGYLLLGRFVGPVPFRRTRFAFLLTMTILLNASALSNIWLHAPTTRKPIVDALHDAIPPGKRILVPAREWHSFVGRNPAIGLDGRSLQEYQTTLLKSVVEFDAEYVVLARNLNTLENRYYWVAEHGVEWADFLHDRTGLMRVIDGGQDEVFEVRKVVGDLSGAY